MKIIFGTGSKFGFFKKKKAKRIVDHALKMGVRKFDTGVNYGQMKSQPLLGECLSKYLKNDRENFILSSKAGTHNSKNFQKLYKSFNPDYIENMINKSIKDLNCFYLDTFYLHGPTLKEIETKGLLKKLKDLLKEGKIKNIGINTHDLHVMKKISSGDYEEINSIQIDFNLLQQDRSTIFNLCKINNINISAGTVLCQGLLLESPISSLINKRSLFYISRMILKKNTRRFLSSAKIARQYIKDNFPNEFHSIPLSFVLNNPSITSIPIGMLSEESIKKNVRISQKTTSSKITENVGNWCLKNCQIID